MVHVIVTFVKNNSQPRHWNDRSCTYTRKDTIVPQKNTDEVHNSPVKFIKSIKDFFECFENKLNIFDLVIFRVNTENDYLSRNV